MACRNVDNRNAYMMKNQMKASRRNTTKVLRSSNPDRGITEMLGRARDFDRVLNESYEGCWYLWDTNKTGKIWCIWHKSNWGSTQLLAEEYDTAKSECKKLRGQSKRDFFCDLLEMGRVEALRVCEHFHKWLWRKDSKFPGRNKIGTFSYTGFNCRKTEERTR